MDPTRRVLAVAGIVAALASLGCAKTERSRVRTPAETSVPLPEWAPENPSPEFLRAARVLKPYAEESSEALGDDLSRRTAQARYKLTLPAAWEFFGTLSDEQIEHLLAAKELRLTMKTMTETQRTALHHHLDVYREVMENVSDPEYGGDPWVVLYKFGATEDLSNVEVQFLVRSSGIVAFLLRVRRRDGSLSPPLPTGLGRI